MKKNQNKIKKNFFWCWNSLSVIWDDRWVSL